MFPEKIYFGDTIIGSDKPSVFLPEIGVLFGQDVDLALSHIQQISEAKCPIIKGELYHNANIVHRDADLHYLTRDGNRTVNYREFVERTVLPFEKWDEIFSACHRLGLHTIVSAYDIEGVNFLGEIGVDCVKIASPHVINVPLLRAAAKSKMKVMIDTGKANIDEVIYATSILKEAGCEELIVNHTPDGHPCEAKDHNLLIIETYKRLFNCPIGLADHYNGTAMMMAAAALGYSIIEKPVVPETDTDDWGALWCMRINDLQLVMSQITECSIARGKPRKEKRYSDLDHQGRMGIVATKNLAKGELITEDKLYGAYPMRGLSILYWDLVVGIKARRNIGAGEPITIKDLDFGTFS